MITSRCISVYTWSLLFTFLTTSVLISLRAGIFSNKITFFTNYNFKLHFYVAYLNDCAYNIANLTCYLATYDSIHYAKLS